MRIIQFSDSFSPVMDGVGSVVFQYAQNIGSKGHECYVVAPQTDTGCRGRFPFEIVDYMGVRMPVIKSYKVGAPALDTATFLENLKPLRTFRLGMTGQLYGGETDGSTEVILDEQLRQMTDYIAEFNKQILQSDEAKRTLQDSMQHWLQVFKFPSVERTTYDRYECTARHQIYPLLGEKVVGDI